MGFSCGINPSKAARHLEAVHVISGRICGIGWQFKIKILNDAIVHGRFG